MLRRGTVLAHYIFRSPVPWHLLTKSEKSQVLWLMANHHGLQWEDGIVAYSMAKRLITTAVVEDDDEMPCTVYVKGRQKREWLANMLDDNAKENLIIETLDADYDDIESLNNLDVTKSMWEILRIAHCKM